MINLTQKIHGLTREEVWKIIPNLPIFVQDIIYSAETSKLNGKLRDSLKLNEEQFQKMLNIILLVYIREIPLSRLTDIFKTELHLEEKGAKNLALELAQKHFWLMHRYLGGVEKLIKSLGGEIPKEQPKPAAAAKETKKEPADDFAKTDFYGDDKDLKTDNIVQKDIKAALEENENIQNQIITSQDIVLTTTGDARKGSIKYWLAEYVQTLGAGYHPNLDRIGFLYNNSNAKRLSHEERQILGAVLKSYDDGDTLPFSEKTERLLIEKLKS